MPHIPTDFGFEDLRRLLESGAGESLRLEFKRKLPEAWNESARVKFSKEICALANSSGGDIFYGVENRESDSGEIIYEPKGLPLNEAKDELETRLLQIVQSRIEPAVRNIRFTWLEGATEGPILRIHAPYSYNRPHAVRVGDNAYRFYARVGNAVSSLTVDEVKREALSSGVLGDRIASHRAERLSRIASGETPVRIPAGIPTAVLHFIPFQSFDVGFSVPIDTDIASPLLGSGAYTSRWTFDGFVAEGPATGQGAKSYTSLIGRSCKPPLLRRRARAEACWMHVGASARRARRPQPRPRCSPYLIRRKSSQIAC